MPCGFCNFTRRSSPADVPVPTLRPSPSEVDEAIFDGTKKLGHWKTAGFFLVGKEFVGDFLHEFFFCDDDDDDDDGQDMWRPSIMIQLPFQEAAMWQCLPNETLHACWLYWFHPLHRLVCTVLVTHPLETAIDFEFAGCFVGEKDVFFKRLQAM